MTGDPYQHEPVGGKNKVHTIVRIVHHITRVLSHVQVRPRYKTLRAGIMGANTPNTSRYVLWRVRIIGCPISSDDKIRDHWDAYAPLPDP